MTAVPVGALLALAILDGAFAGFRSSAGRTGLVSHRRYDRRVAWRGAGLMYVLLSPAIAIACADVVLRPGGLEDCARAGTAMLAVYGPCALLVLAALACYVTLNWQLKYLASALVLGPFTLFRPGIAILGAALGMGLGKDVVTASAAVLSAIAVLAVEPLVGRLWYTRNPPPGQPAESPPPARHANSHTLPDSKAPDTPCRLPPGQNEAICAPSAAS
jgi:hypothetical protein